MNTLLKIIMTAVLTVLFLSGTGIAGGATQISPARSNIIISDDTSELLEFDEYGVVTNLGYPNVNYKGSERIALNPGEAEQAVQSILRVMPRLTGGYNMGFLHHIPINTRASTHVAGGALIRRGKQANDSTEEKGIDPMLQFGMTYKLTPGLSVTAELQRYFKSDDDDIQRYAVGMVYNF